MFQENFTVQSLINLKIPALLAGLAGAFVTMLHKTEGSLQARVTGFIIAVLTVIYIVPLLLWGIEWKFSAVLPGLVENVVSFVFGMISQSLTEAFADDPAGTVFKGTAFVKRVKRAIWNGEIASKENEVKNNE